MAMTGASLPGLARAAVGLLALVLGPLELGCAALRASDQDPDFGARFTYRGQNETTQAKLEGDRLFGATIDGHAGTEIPHETSVSLRDIVS